MPYPPTPFHPPNSERILQNCSVSILAATRNKSSGVSKLFVDGELSVEQWEQNDNTSYTFYNPYGKCSHFSESEAGELFKMSLEKIGGWDAVDRTSNTVKLHHIQKLNWWQWRLSAFVSKLSSYFQLKFA